MFSDFELIHFSSEHFPMSCRRHQTVKTKDPKIVNEKIFVYTNLPQSKIFMGFSLGYAKEID